METIYYETLPHTGLRDYISSYWYMKAGTASKVNEYDILPDGYFDLIFTIKNCALTEISLTGIWEHMVTVKPENGTGMFGIRFKPAALTELLNLRINGLLNSSSPVDLKEFSIETSVIADALAGEDIMNSISYLNHQFLLKTDHSSNDSRMKAFFEFVDRSSGSESVESICCEIGLSARQLHRKLTGLIGIGPKEYSGIARFRDNISNIADYRGYYDQSHMIKNFKKYTGMTPGELNPADNVRILQYNGSDLLYNR